MDMIDILCNHSTILVTYSILSSIYFEPYILQGASIKNLEASSNGNGRVAAVKLEDGSIVEADTVSLLFPF
jgi:hypothetical protein